MGIFKSLGLVIPAKAGIQLLCLCLSRVSLVEKTRRFVIYSSESPVGDSDETGIFVSRALLYIHSRTYSLFY